MRRFWIHAWLLGALWGGLPISGAEIERCQIEEVEDPIIIRLRCGPTERRLRLPAIRPPRPGPPQLGGEPFAEEARQEARRWLAGVEVSLGTSPRPAREPVIRLPGGEELAAALVRRGLVYVEDDGSGAPSVRLLSAEREARSEGRGVWSYEAWRNHREESTRGVVLPRPRPSTPRPPLAVRARKLSDKSWEERRRAFEAAMAELEEPDTGSETRKD